MSYQHGASMLEDSVFDKLEAYVDDVQNKLWILTFFQLFTHYLLHRLNTREGQLPRIVDLKAFRSKLE